MSEVTGAMTSFSGADLSVTFGNKVIGELQQITYAIERRKAPVYTLGSADPRSFSRGIRGIAGSLIFAIFDRDALFEELLDAWDNIAPKAMFTAAGNQVTRDLDGFEKALSMTGWNNAPNDVAPVQDSIDGTSDVDVPFGFDIIRQENIIYSDMLPPFDITMTFANEYGQAAFQKIYDVDILNEGSGVNVSSIVMEREMTYIARRISPILKGVYTRDENNRQIVKDNYVTRK